MPKQILILFSIIIIVVSIFVINETDFFNSNNATSSNVTVQFDDFQPKIVADEQHQSKQDLSLTEQLTHNLVKAGWSSNTANKVVTLNQEWFTILQTNYSKALEKQMSLLKRLSDYPYLMPLINEHPEIASLLASVDNPELMAQSFEQLQCYDIMLGLFVQHAAPEDAKMLAEALANQHNLMCRLIQRGLVGSQALFIFPRHNPGVAEYKSWLVEVLNNGLSQSDEKLSSLVALLFEQGAIIRNKMIETPSFRYQFRNDLWTKLIRVVNKTQLPIELYLSEPNLWDLLALPSGERLLEQWLWFLSLDRIINLTPAKILFGEEAYPKPLHPFIIESILNEDSNTLIALLHFGHTPLFVKFMQRQLSDKLKQKAFNKLIAQEANYPILLEDWDRASNENLHDDLINENSGLISTLKKTVQGREVSGGEAFWAIFDIIDITTSVVTLGATSIISSGVRLGVKKGVKNIAKQNAKGFFKDIFKDKVKKKIAQKLPNSILKSAAIKQIFEKILFTFKQNGGKIPKNKTVDITSMLQFLFKKANVNRTTFKRINNSWDARLFMRKDAKVLVDINFKQLSSKACSFFKTTSTINILDGADTIAKEVTCGLVDIYEFQEKLAQQKNNSAWFSMNSIGIGIQ